MSTRASSAISPASPALSPAALPEQPNKQLGAQHAVSQQQQQLAQRAVAPQAAAEAGADHALLTPRLDAILEAYAKDGRGDGEMLKALLHAKAKEDELRAANTVAVYTYYAQMSQIAALQQQQQQQLALAQAPNSAKASAPYHLLSPPCEPTHPTELPKAPLSSGKRSRQASLSADDEASATSPASSSTSLPSVSSSSGKVARTSPPPSVASASQRQGPRSASPPDLALGPAAAAAARPVSHADVMSALRRKCEANQQAKQQPSGPRPLAPKPPSVQSRASSVASNSDSPAPARQPPRKRRRSSPQEQQQPPVVSRHTAFLRTVDGLAAPAAAAAATARESSEEAHPASPVSPVEPSQAAPAVATGTRNKLALLLHASETSDAHSMPSWYGGSTPVTSDVRGSPVEAA
ncbi:hypothetical protein JCM8202v2_001142 [Rhodotorula sphaerocarpa]